MSIPKQHRKMMATLGIVLCSMLALSAGHLVAAEHATHQHEHGAAHATLNDGKKWGTDEALRQGMENIRNAMNASLHQIHDGKLTTAGYRTLAKKLNDELGNIVAHCKLEPKADAQLHLIVADLAAGSEAMAGQAKKAQRRNGALKVLAALEKYDSHFDHPGWKAIQH